MKTQYFRLSLLVIAFVCFAAAGLIASILKDDMTTAPETLEGEPLRNHIEKIIKENPVYDISGAGHQGALR
jgi:hypothetical protein